MYSLEPWREISTSSRRGCQIQITLVDGAFSSAWDAPSNMTTARKLAVAISAVWLLHVAQVGAACKESVRPSPESRGDCELNETDFDLVGQIQRCVLARPVERIEMERARESVRNSNCFLDAVLRPEVSDAIRRGAESYLAMPRSERRSIESNKFHEALEAEFRASWDPSESEDVLGLVEVFIERAYPLEVYDANPTSGLVKRAHRLGIYSRIIKNRWVLIEYAAYLTDSSTVRSSATRWLKELDRKRAPPESYSAKGCKKKILYDWATTSRPRWTYAALPAEAFKYGPTVVHVGICPDDQSLWFYHYLVGWRKVPDGDIVAMCRENLFSSELDRSPVVIACKQFE